MTIPVQRVKYICQVCTVPFFRRAREALRHGPHKYCSMRCRGLSMRRRVGLLCDQCRRLFERALAEVLRHRNAWCSWKCFRAHQIATGTSYPKIGNRHAHRIVGEKIVGRPLRRNEVVHHKDENRRNFSRRNLTVKTRAKHSSDHNRGIVRSEEYKRKMSVAVKRALAARRAR
jgi:hypothetical protein